MLRGAEMLFAAIFSVVFLKRSLNRNNYIGIGCCLVGLHCAAESCHSHCSLQDLKYFVYMTAFLHAMHPQALAEKEQQQSQHARLPCN